MLKEALEFLSRQAAAAAGPQHKEIDLTKTHAATRLDGSTFMIGGDPAPRKHAAQNLETIVSFAEVNEKAVIWYSRAEIVCLTDDDVRRDRVTVKMLLSDQIKKLGELEGKPLINHRDLLFMLRTVFTDQSLGASPTLVELLRKVTFSTGAKTDSEIGRGKSSVGKSLSADATFLDKVPDKITLNVPVFTNSFARRTYDVQCALEIFEDVASFKLFPFPGEIEKAYFSAEADLSANLLALLGDTKRPVYCGNP